MKSINLVYLEYKYVEKQHLSFYFIGEVQTCHAISIYNRIIFYLSQEEPLLSKKNPSFCVFLMEKQHYLILISIFLFQV